MSVILLGEQNPTFPDDFQRRLQDFDKDLLIVWHRPPHWPRHRRGVWKVEMCTQHHAGFNLTGRPIHDHTCQRSYVLMCQDDEGTPMPLGDWIFTKLGEMRANSESYGGETERGLRNFRAASAALDKELEEKRCAGREEIKRLNTLDHRVQWNRLWNLIERHDMRPNR